MEKQYKVIILFLVVLLFADMSAHSQNEQYYFRHLTIEDGLPTNHINKVIKDSNGIIWMTTQNGLCRYDGYDFKIYQYNPEDTSSLTHNNLYDLIIEDNYGYLWIGTLWGLNKFDPYLETFTRYLPDPENPNSICSGRIKCLHLDRTGTLWIGTGLYGQLAKYDPATDSFVNYSGIIQLDSNEWGTIETIYDDKNGLLWLGTSKGVFQFDRQDETTTPLKPPSSLPDTILNTCRKILEDQHGNMWFQTNWVILKYKRNSETPMMEVVWDQKKIGDDCFISDMIIESDHGKQLIWFTSCDVKIFDPAKPLEDIQTIKTSNFEVPGSILGNKPKYILKDESDIFWISTNLGLNVLDLRRSQVNTNTIFYDEYKCDALVLLEDSRGDIWIGTDTQRILKFNNNMELVHEYDRVITKEARSKPMGSIRSLLEDSYNNIWAGCGNGIYKLDRKLNEFTEYSVAWAYSLKSSPMMINTIFEDSDTNIWLGTYSGIYFLKNESYSLPEPFEWKNFGSGTRPVKTIIEDQLGYLWIGIDAQGIYRLPIGKKEHVIPENFNHEPGNSKSLSSMNVISIYEDHNGNLWVGTRNGLNRYDRENDSFDRIHFKDSPGADFIFDLTGDNSNNLWLSTQGGLYKLNLKTLESSEKNTVRLKRLLPFRDIYEHKISKHKDGAIFIGAKFQSKNGFFTFHPDSIKESKNPPPIVITDIQANNRRVDLDSNIIHKSNIILSFNENFFSVRFAALDFTDPLQNQYAYYLEGYEEEWTYCGTRREAFYTKVPPGKYVFHAKGSNNDGYWNETGASIGITIMPPPWRTWWAYTLYGIALGILLLAFRLYDLKRQRLKQALKVEQLEAEKLKELDGMKSRFFANISHEFRTPLTLILGPLEKLRSMFNHSAAEENLNIMQRNARRLQNLINQLLSLSRLEAGEMKLRAREEDIVTFVKSYVQLFESLAKQKEIELVFKAEIESIAIYIDKDKLEKIIYNLLSNAFKFTQAGGRIEIEVSANGVDTNKLPAANLETNYTVISISDTGSGISPDHLPHIFDRFYQVDDSFIKDQEGTGIGLALVKEFVDLHHGQVLVESNLGQGAIFRVYLPMGKNHLREEEIDTGLLSEENIHPSEIIEEIWEMETESQKSDSGPPKSKLETEKPLLLIVEDNIDLHVYMNSQLSNDYRIIDAMDGVKGLEKAIETIPDLIISDVMMSEMDGYELCHKVKTDERTSHIPLILLTARASMDSKIEGLEKGADDFITKPFDVLELHTRIKNLIKQRRRLHEKLTRNIRRMGLENLMELEVEDMTSTDQNFMQKALHVIHENLSSPDFDIEKFSSSFALSRIQVHRKLKGLTGEAPGSFIRQIRLNKAADLLKMQTGTVSEIAFSVGFNNLSYFTKCFKEQFGVVPSEYGGTNS
jgi:signal transduction histidine kinase/ligand-binding sensor domain-containing protein/DNA-binding response OmpR family regulator